MALFLSEGPNFNAKKELAHTCDLGEKKNKIQSIKKNHKTLKQSQQYFLVSLILQADFRTEGHKGHGQGSS